MEQADHSAVLIHYAEAPTHAICLSKDGSLNQQTILASLQVHFLFPDYFGENLDAAFDLLLDVVDTLNQPTVWQFCTGKNANTDNDALARWQQLMQDVIDYASGKGVMLQVELFVEP